MKPRALILHANGTNRDRDLAQAFELAGAEPEVVHINQLRQRGAGERGWGDYQILGVPGGFSYADALGAGKLFGLDLKHYFADEVGAFVASGKPVIGICNGFQALVQAGLLPGNGRATLTQNARGHFECRWVTLRVAEKTNCLWTRGLSEPIHCPAAHGEGRFVAEAGETFPEEQIALRYAAADGGALADEKFEAHYPLNPNGSAGDIAGVCNAQGNVLGLMPHPENHVFEYQHPQWTRGARGGMGLPLLRNAVRHVGAG